MLMRQLFDPETSTWSYLLADEDTREAVLIDPVLEQVERDLQLLGELGLTLRWALDTHARADHVTGLGALREKTGCQTVLSERAGSGWADHLVKQPLPPDRRPRQPEAGVRTLIPARKGPQP